MVDYLIVNLHNLLRSRLPASSFYYTQPAAGTQRGRISAESLLFIILKSLKKISTSDLDWSYEKYKDVC